MPFIGFIVGVILVVIGFYLNGYNFDTRGYDAVNLYLLSLIIGFICAGIFKLFDET